MMSRQYAPYHPSSFRDELLAASGIGGKVQRRLSAKLGAAGGMLYAAGVTVALVLVYRHGEKMRKQLALLNLKRKTEQSVAQLVSPFSKLEFW